MTKESNRRFRADKSSVLNLCILKLLPRLDDRGSFTRLFCPDELKKLGWGKPISQINHSRTLIKGTIRGLHYQSSPDQEAKLVRCIKGKIFDVVVDVRPQSETYLKYETFLLSDKDETFILVPEGFAHGFQTLVDNVELLYFHDHPHCPQSEVIINPNDPSVGVEWPLRPSKIAEKDRCKEFL